MTSIADREFSVLGTRPIRHDGLDKVVGRAVYGADIKLAGMVHGAVLRSPYPHAKLLSIDTSKAEIIPGVLAVVTGKDLPVAQSKLLDLTEEITTARFASDRVLAGEKALFRGHPVAAVAAVDLNTAQEALKSIEVSYEVLPAVFSAADAMAPDAPILHEHLVGKDLGEKITGTNVAEHMRQDAGDVDAAFAIADLVVDRTFHIPSAHQGYIEPQNATAFWGQDGKITVWTSTQGPFPLRGAVASILDVPMSDIKVVPLEIGGGFGGKINAYLEPVAALLSKKCGRPVKIVMDRRSVFEATGPAPGGTVRVKMGAKSDGTIVAAQSEIHYGAGAYPGASINGASTCMFACYRIENVRIDAYDVVINMSKTAAYRAPGTPQATFASECVVDELAAGLGIDPIEFRLKNAVSEGDRRADGMAYPAIGYVETLEAIKYSDHYQSPIGEPGEPTKKRGRGLASGFWQGAGNRSTVTLSVTDDGDVMLVEGNTDIGGTRTTIAMQAAEILGLPAEDVHPSVVDTDSVGYTDLTAGSRTTYATGAAAVKAAEQVIKEMTGRVAMIWETDAENIEFSRGTFSNAIAGDQTMTFKEVVSQLNRTGGPISTTATVNMRGSGGGSFATHLIDVEIDTETGKVQVIRYTAAQDAGRAVHPGYVEGQMEGGAVQGIGWALNEEYVVGEDGAVQNATFLDYRMPTALDIPNLTSIIVEVPNTMHPLGVRGIGETGIVPPAPAVANAINSALGIRFTRLPMKPGRIMAALKGWSGGDD